MIKGCLRHRISQDGKKREPLQKKKGNERLIKQENRALDFETGKITTSRKDKENKAET